MTHPTTPENEHPYDTDTYEVLRMALKDGVVHSPNDDHTKVMEGRAQLGLFYRVAADNVIVAWAASSWGATIKGAEALDEYDRIQRGGSGR